MALDDFVQWVRQLRQRRRAERRPKGFDEDAATTISRVQPYTMLSPNKLFVLIEAVRYVHRYGIPGAMVECGVWRGGVVMAAAMTFEQLGTTDRNFYLYDTFTGMTRPTAKDNSVHGETDPREEYRLTQTGPDSSDWCRAGLDEVRQNLASTGYGCERFVTVKGKVEDTLPGTLPEQIALLHLDTDWYESTRHEMVHLFPRLVRKGVLVVDDYHTWSGVREAVDEYIAGADTPMFLVTVEDSVVGVRP